MCYPRKPSWRDKKPKDGCPAPEPGTVPIRSSSPGGQEFTIEKRKGESGQEKRGIKRLHILMLCGRAASTQVADSKES